MSDEFMGYLSSPQRILRFRASHLALPAMSTLDVHVHRNKIRDNPRIARHWCAFVEQAFFPITVTCVAASWTLPD